MENNEFSDQNKIIPQLINSLRITDNSNVPDMEPVVYIDGAPFAIKGDVSVVGGKEKAGKTNTAIFILATALSSQIDSTDDTLKIRSSFSERKPVVFIDTEQSRSSTKKLVQTIMKILRVDKMPENLFVYNFRSLYRQEEKKEALFELFKIHNDAHLWVIDGIADLTPDPNLPEPSNKLIAELMATAERLNTCVIVYLHENPGQNTKLRGNLGSELQRKCYGTIGVKKDKDRKIHSMESRLLRHAGDFDEIFFRYDIEKGRMVLLDGSEAEDYKKDRSGENQKRELRYKLAYQCTVGGSERISYKEFINRIVNHAPRIENKRYSETTAKSRLREMQDFNIVDKDEEGKYHLLTSQKEGKDK